MLRLSLARDEHAQSGRSKPSVFDANYSPDGSESSSSSQKYGSQASRSRSPSPAAPELSRRMSPSPTRNRAPRANTVPHTRSASQAIPSTSHLPRSRTHPSDLSAAVPQTLFRRPSRNRNEEVLRSRLEGVLSSTCSSRDFSCPPSPQRRRAATNGDGQSFGLITPPQTLGHGTLPPHPSMTRSKTSPAVSRSSRAGTSTPSPITPPPSPPFDASRIALQLRDREGYVSFADVQGLGVPRDIGDEDDCDPERGRGRWWTLWKG